MTLLNFAHVLLFNSAIEGDHICVIWMSLRF